MPKFVFPKLTQKQRESIKLYVLKGYTLYEIAEMYEVSYSVVNRYYRWENEVFTSVAVEMYGKADAYYEDEDDYGLQFSKIPIYDPAEFKGQELKIYNDLINGEK